MEVLPTGWEVNGRHYEATWSPFSTADNLITYYGAITDGDGQYVGDVVRAFERDSSEGDIHAYHDRLSIRRDFQGQGIGSAFLKACEDSYVRVGITEIRLHANLDVGGYAWARTGFDFLDRKEAAATVNGMIDGIQPSDPPSVRDELLAIRGKMSDGQWPTPFELSNVGYSQRSLADGRVTWFGKEMLMTMEWNAKKILTPAAEEAIAAAAGMSRGEFLRALGNLHHRHSVAHAADAPPAPERKDGSLWNLDFWAPETIEAQFQSAAAGLFARYRGTPESLAAMKARLYAEFANPYHDERGRFAPKNTGRRVPTKGIVDDEMPIGHLEVDAGGGHSFEVVGGDTVDELWANLVGVPESDSWTVDEASDPRFAPNRGFGYHLIPGQTMTRMRPSATGPLLYDVGAMAGVPVDELPGPYLGMNGNGGMLYEIPGTERPATTVFRIMDIEEWNQAKERGYFQSDGRMNLVEAEGTVWSTRTTGTFYAPPVGHTGVIVRARMDPADGWFMDMQENGRTSVDDYVKTHAPIPFDRVEAVTVPFEVYEEEFGNYGNTMTKYRVIDDDSLVASAQFANPYHDELGRFAPKNTADASTEFTAAHQFRNPYKDELGRFTTPEGDADGVEDIEIDHDPDFPVKEGFKRVFTHNARLRAAKERGVSIPPGWKNTQVSKDPDAPGLRARGVDAAGRVQPRYSRDHIESASAEKYQRILSFQTRYAERLDDHLREDAETDPTAGAVVLMRRMGLRPGSTADTRAKVQAYGATTLEARHVKFLDDGETVKLDFTGKKGVRIQLSTKDKLVYRTLLAHTAGKKPGERIFQTTSDRTNAYLTRVLPDDAPKFTNRDLRTILGTGYARRMTRRMPIPRTAAENRRARKKVAERVARILGNEPGEALRSYIAPEVFDAAGW